MRWHLFRSRGPGQRPPFRPQLEPLEPRRVPSFAGFMGALSHAFSHAAAPVERVVQRVAAPVEHAVQQVAAPVEQAVQNTVAPVEQAVQRAAAPVEQAVQHIAAPVQHAVQQAAAPVEQAVQNTVAAVEHAVQQAAAPVEQAVHQAAALVERAAPVEHALAQAVQQFTIDRFSDKGGDLRHPGPDGPAGKTHLPPPGPGESPGGIALSRPGGFPGGWINLPGPGPSGLPGGVDLPRPGPGSTPVGIDLPLPGPDLPGGIHVPLPGPDLPPGGIHVPLPGPDLPGGIHLPHPGGIPGGGLDFPGLRGGLVLKNEQETDPPKEQGPNEGPPPTGSQPTGTNEKTDLTDTKIDTQIDKAGLPRGGRVPFIPKLGKDKRGEPILEKATVRYGAKKGKKGFVDTKGRIWIKDRAHAGYPDHWDVQVDGGKTYFRVDLTGNPLD